MAAAVPQNPEASRAGTGWLVPPDTPSGLHIDLDGLIEAEQLSPEVISLLGKVMAELQRAAKVSAKDPCPKLSSCTDYTGDCTKLTDCVIYKVKIASPRAPAREKSR
jgi:hypothetical protein